MTDDDYQLKWLMILLDGDDDNHDDDQHWWSAPNQTKEMKPKQIQKVTKQIENKSTW